MKTEHGIIHPRSQGLIDYAYKYAKEAHGTQKRRYTDNLYIDHPVAVAKLVHSVTEDCDMIAAALLHDTVEDTEVTQEQILKEFGFRIAQFVQELTEFSVPSDGNRAIRKELDRRYLSRVSPQAKTIKLADCIHNSESILEHAEGLKHVYMEEITLLNEDLVEGDQKLYSGLHDICYGYKVKYNIN